MGSDFDARLRATASSKGSAVEQFNMIEPVVLLIKEYPSVFLTIFLGGIVAVLAGAYLLLLISAHFPRAELASERLYRTVTAEGRITEERELPDTCYQDDASQGSNRSCLSKSNEKERQEEILVSVVVPAYNESLRLSVMLAEAISFLTDAYPGMPSWEILIVDDGSKDDTSEVALEFTKKQVLQGQPIPEGAVRVCKLAKNRGKGGAVTHGMKHVRGKYAIFADADGASRFSDMKGLLEKCREIDIDGYGVAVGSRAHMVNTDAVVKRSKIRNLLMYTFHTYLRVMGIKSIKDTQCGFKLFSLNALRAIFPHMHNEGWIFDVEILLLAEKIGIPMVEVPITWHEVEGSKVSLVKDSLKMAWDLIILRGSYTVGIYGGGVGVKGNL